MKIARIVAREIFDGQGWPTVQCKLYLDNGAFVTSSVPAGTSLGVHEAIELRDGGTRLGGKGVLKACENIEQIIAPMLIGREPQALEMDMQMIELDGTPNKSRLGANALLAVSMALYRAQSLTEEVGLYEFFAQLGEADTVTIPFPLLNVINGGVHVDNNLSIQEIMLIPVGAPTFRSAFEVGVLVFHELGTILEELGKPLSAGPEGGYACKFTDEREALDCVLEAIERINKRHALSCMIALDVAASQFYDSATGLYSWNDKQLTSDEMIAVYENLVAQYPICFIEDGLSQDDWGGWGKLMRALNNKTQIVADDLTVTDIRRIVLASEERAATSIIIKPNQVGTVTETLQAIAFCKMSGLNTIVSHRSSETDDTFIADLAVGISASHIKSGSCAHSLGLPKYNRLLTIEDELTFSIFDS